MIWEAIAAHATGSAYLRFTSPRPGSTPLPDLLAAAEHAAGGLRSVLAAARPGRTHAAAAGSHGDPSGSGQPRIGILMANGEPWMRTLLATLRLGGVCVPLAVPASFQSLDAYQVHLGRIAASGALDVVVFDGAVEPVIPALRQACVGVVFVHHAELSRSGPRSLPPVNADPEQLAVLQFTSGSTSAPRGVLLTHRNVMAGLHPVTHDIGWDVRADAMAVWIPLFHDMGLFTALGALVRGSSVCLWTPTEFARRPLEWLRSFASSPATVVAAPNFFFDYLVAAVAEAPPPPSDLDLARWRVALNGAEPVRWQTIAAFSERFAPYGFSPSAMLPVYGLAEATLPVTASRPGELPRRLDIDRGALGAGGGVRTLVCVGRPVSGIEVRIAAQPGAAGPFAIGEVQARGRAVMKGYWNVPDREQPFTADGWLRTGDLGFVDASGGLFITGRAKDMIVINGQNYYAEDVEALVHDAAFVERRHCAAVPWTDADGHESMLVLVETKLTGAEADAFAEAVRRMITAQIGLTAVEVRAVATRTLPYTSSGKIRRRQARRQEMP